MSTPHIKFVYNICPIVDDYVFSIVGDDIVEPTGRKTRHYAACVYTFNNGMRVEIHSDRPGVWFIVQPVECEIDEMRIEETCSIRTIDAGTLCISPKDITKEYYDVHEYQCGKFIRIGEYGRWYGERFYG